MALNDAYLAVFDNPAGERVLRHLESMFGAKDTIEPEELINKGLEVKGTLSRVPIDPIGMAKRHGLRSAYWKICAMVENARKEKGSGG